MGADGRWTTLSDRPAVTNHPIHVSLRMAATAEIKARGVRYLLLRPGDLGFDDFERYPQAWGVTPVGHIMGVHLYRIN